MTEIIEERLVVHPEPIPPISGQERDVIVLDATTGEIIAGGHAINGSIILKDQRGRVQVRLDHRANLWLGGNGQDGDVVIFPRNVSDTTDANQASIHLDGDRGISARTSTDGRAAVSGVHGGDGNGVYGETGDRNDMSGVYGIGPFRGVTGASDGGVGVYGTTNSIEYAAIQAENSGNGPALNLRRGKLTIAAGSGTSPGGRTVGSVVVDDFDCPDDMVIYRSRATVTNSHATGSSLVFLTCEDSQAYATVTRTAPGEFDIQVSVVDPRGRRHPLEARSQLIIGQVTVNYLIVN